MITFNTGRKYTAKGQRIAAAIVDGRTYFSDVDRMIFGVFTSPVECTRADVLEAYDAGVYQWTAHSILRELDKAAAAI